MDNYLLCERLLKAETEAEVEAALKAAGYLEDDPALWQPFGGFGMNLNQINNQQSDPTAAMVEKLINSIDAVLLAACYRAGLDPKSPSAPRTMSDAVAELFKVKDGRLENLTPKERTALADRIHFVATGPKSEPCYLVVDTGEGQTPTSFKDTFLSLTKQNKDEIPFVQGRFNCGGTGVLPFCGEHKYQLIISRRQPGCPVVLGDSTKDLWGFTLVRRQRAAPGRKSSMYVYLAPSDSILTFKRDAIPALPGPSSKNSPAKPYAQALQFGSCIKLYGYRWKRKAIATTEARYELERFLHSVPLPFRITETRDYRANFYSSTLSGILAHLSDDSPEEAEADSKFEKGLGPAYGEINLPKIGKLPFRLFLLKEDYDSGHFPHGVYFTLNGQVHGDLPANFISTTLKFDYLSKTLLVSVDCTEMVSSAREDFLMASRDRVRRNEVYDGIFSALRDELREHPGLREHNSLRKKKRLDQTLSKEENASDYLRDLLKSDPTLASILGMGGNISSVASPTTVTLVPFHGRKFPTYFRLSKEPKGGLTKACPLNRTVRIEFDTDAEDDYFSRPDSPGTVTFDPPNLCVSSHLWGGKYTCKFQMPYNAGIGDIVTIKASVSDVERDGKDQPFVAQFAIKGVAETDDRASTGGTNRPGRKPTEVGKQTAPLLAAPDIREIRRENWNDPQFNFDEYSAAKITNADESGGYTFWINMDNRFLANELLKNKQEDGPLLKHWFKYGIALSALGVLKELERLPKIRKDNEPENDKAADQLDIGTVEKYCAGFARVVVPIIRALHKGPAMQEPVAQAAD